MPESNNSTATQASKGLLEKPQNSMNGSGSLNMNSLSKMNESRQEGAVTKAIDNQISKFQSGVYLALAVGAMAISAALAARSEKKGLANFVGLWAPSFLMLGLYNKIVKAQS